MVVEHGFPGSQKLAATPLLGIAVGTAEPGDCMRAEEKRDLRDFAWPSVSKTFAHTLRTRFTDETVGDLLKFIDPGHLKEHHLTEGAFPLRGVGEMNPKKGGNSLS